MDAVDTVAKFGFSRIPADGYEGRHVIVLAGEAVQEIRRIAEQAEGAAAEIRANGNLTGAGRATELAKLGEGELARLDYARLLDELRAARERARGELTAAAREPDGAARAVRETHLQTHLLGMDPSARAAAFNDAVERGDRLTFEAVRGAPAVLELVPPDVLAAGEQAWAARQAPERARELADLERTIEELERTLAAARRAVAAATGVGDGDPVRTAAAGGGG